MIEAGKGFYLRRHPARLMKHYAEHGYRVVRLEEPLAGFAGLRDGLVRALALPDYTGRNRDALSDVLTDAQALGELAAAGVPQLLLVLADWQDYARTDPVDFAASLELLLDAGRFWRSQGGDLSLCLEA